MTFQALKTKLKFDRNELAGSFGDIGTDFPLIIGIILASGMNPVSVLVIYGILQIMTGLIYGIPMPVQPLKAMAVIVITQKLGGNILCGAGLAIGVFMLLLSLSGLINFIARVVPLCVVRGIQLGLGIQLATLALKDYVPADGLIGYGIALLSFIIIILLMGNRRYPPALLIIAIGIIYAITLNLNLANIAQGIGLHLPEFHVPAWPDILAGFLILTLPQIPLSIGNSILATQQTARDLFPDKPPLTVRKISLTYSIMNLIAPFFGGIPVCHGAGGMAGHYTFGARTGGAIVIYGLIYLIAGLFFGGVFAEIVNIFPKPMLGVILFFEALALLKLCFGTAFLPIGRAPHSLGDAGDKQQIMLMIMVGLMAVGLPYGYLIGLVVGTILALIWEKSLLKNSTITS
ncbi:MAG: transporter [Planctomycetes bacterium]|nr:transporter [Planctomycetota bacterium]